MSGIFMTIYELNIITTKLTKIYYSIYILIYIIILFIGNHSIPGTYLYPTVTQNN